MPVAKCSEPLCPKDSWNRGRCSAHQFANDKAIKDSTAYRSVYATKRWRNLRMQVIKEQRGKCATPGCVNLATDVDHVVGMRDGGAAYDRSNLQALCHRHHSMKTISEVIHSKG